MYICWFDYIYFDLKILKCTKKKFFTWTILHLNFLCVSILRILNSFPNDFNERLCMIYIYNAEFEHFTVSCFKKIVLMAYRHRSRQTYTYLNSRTSWNPIVRNFDFGNKFDNQLFDDSVYCVWVFLSRHIVFWFSVILKMR